MRKSRQKNPNRVAAGRKSKRKGNGNERDAANQFKTWWGVGEWARVPASGGWATVNHREAFRACGDIMTTDIEFPFTVELKHVEGWDLNQMLTAPACLPYEWWAQTTGETPEDSIPLLVMRRNRSKPLVMTRPFPALNGHLTDNNVVRFYLHGTETLVIFKLEDLFKISREVILDMAKEEIPRCDTCKKIVIKCGCIEKSLNK